MPRFPIHDQGLSLSVPREPRERPLTISLASSSTLSRSWSSEPFSPGLQMFVIVENYSYRTSTATFKDTVIDKR